MCRGLDGVAEVGELLDEARRSVALGTAVEVVGPEVLVEGAVAQHVVGSGQDGRGDGADRLLRAAAGTQAPELGLQVAGLLARGRPGALHEGGLQPRRALAQACPPSPPGPRRYAGRCRQPHRPWHPGQRWTTTEAIK